MVTEKTKVLVVVDKIMDGEPVTVEDVNRLTILFRSPIQISNPSQEDAAVLKKKLQEVISQWI